MKHVLSKVFVTAFVAGFSAGPALAQQQIQLHVISAQAPRMLTVNTISNFMLPEINRRLAENGNEYTIRWRESYAGVVAGNTEVFSAVQNRIGDIGQVGTLFEASRLPLSQMTFQVPFTGASAPQMLDALAVLREEIPEFDAAFEAYDQRLLGLMATSSYVLVTNFPVETLDDLEGRRIGLPGSAANWVLGTGAVAVNSQLGDYYNSMSTGVYDGVIAFASAIVPYSLYEVAPYITDIRMGAVQSAALTINEGVWNGLPEEVQLVIAEVANEMVANLGEAEERQAGGAFAIAAERGATVTVLSPEERARWAASMPNLALQWSEMLDARNLPASALVSGYMELLREGGADIARDWDLE